MTVADKWFGNKTSDSETDTVILQGTPNGNYLVTCSKHGRLPGSYNGINAARDFARKHIGSHNTMANPVKMYEDDELVETYG